MSGWSVGLVVTGAEIRVAVNVPGEPLTVADAQALADCLARLLEPEPGAQEIVR